MQQFQGLIGIVVMLGIALLLSRGWKRIPWRIVIGGVALQFVLAWLLLAFPPLVKAVDAAAHAVTVVIGAADEGSFFVFGKLSWAFDPGAVSESGAPVETPWGFVFAFRVLTIIVFFAALMAILYHWGIMQRVIAALAWVLRGTLGVTGTEALAMAANVFVGQTEAPLCVRPYIGKMTQSQLMTLMVGGFATIAGSVLAAYVSILGGADQETQKLFAKHLLTASLMSAPAAFVIAKIIVPETEEPFDEGLKMAKGASDGEGGTTTNVLDAAAAGTTDGLRLAMNVGAMLIAFVSLIALVNIVLDGVGDWWVSAEAADSADKSLTLQMLLGWVFTPLAWSMGVPWEDCGVFGALLGEKLIATEFLAYLHLGQAMNPGEGQEPEIGARAGQIAAYALCGFANFPSIGIQIGGLTALAPERRSAFAGLAMKAMIGGALASWMTACVASVFI